MFFRVLKLLLSRISPTSSLLSDSYDRISPGYDLAWTSHMRELTDSLIDQMHIQQGQNALDLTCGTGYATSLIADRTKNATTGIDASAGMLACAQTNYPNCNFIQADILQHLTTLEGNSLDIVTCCWGLGYSKPLAVLRQIKRVLKPGGKLGIIDNTIFSLREVMYASFLTFMEQPDKLQNLMKFRFLTGPGQLNLWFRLAGLKPTTLFAGDKSYDVASGTEAIDRLKATGAAAGFEYASTPANTEEIDQRFAEILEQKYSRNGSIAITHRYLGGIAVK